MNWNALLEKAPDAVMVILVIYFALELSKQQRENSKDVMATWREHLKQQDERWIAFLLESREKSNSAMLQMSQELKEATKQIAALTVLLNSHDARASERTRPLPQQRGKQHNDE